MSDSHGIDQWEEDIKDDPTWRYYKRDLAMGFHLSGKEFDFVSALEVIEHMIDTDKFLSECSTSLKEGGFLVVSTPNVNSLRNRLRVPLGRYPAGLEYKNVIHHVRLYNLPSLKNHLQEHRFEVIRAIGVSFLPSRLLTYRVFKALSDLVADSFPQLCSNIIVVARSTKQMQATQ